MSRERLALFGTLGAALLTVIGVIASSLISANTQETILLEPLRATQTYEATNNQTTPLPTESPTSTLQPNTFVIFDGEITHSSVGGLQTFAAGENIENFVAEVKFTTPANFDNRPWNFAIFFRASPGVANGYRLWVNSDTNTWGLSFWDGNSYVFVRANESLDANILNSADEENIMKVVSYENMGCFFVNDRHISNLNLTGLRQKGDVAIGLDGQHYQFTGGTTRFYDFLVREITELECPE